MKNNSTEPPQPGEIWECHRAGRTYTIVVIARDEAATTLCVICESSGQAWVGNLFEFVQAMGGEQRSGLVKVM